MTRIFRRFADSSSRKRFETIRKRGNVNWVTGGKKEEKKKEKKMKGGAEQLRGKLAALDEIRVATLFSFGYLIKIV